MNIDHGQRIRDGYRRVFNELTLILGESPLILKSILGLTKYDIKGLKSAKFWVDNQAYVKLERLANAARHLRCSNTSLSIVQQRRLLTRATINADHHGPRIPLLDYILATDNYSESNSKIDQIMAEYENNKK